MDRKIRMRVELLTCFNKLERSGQVYYSAEVQDHEGQAKKTFES